MLDEDDALLPPPVGPEYRGLNLSCCISTGDSDQVDLIYSMIFWPRKCPTERNSRLDWKGGSLLTIGEEERENLGKKDVQGGMWELRPGVRSLCKVCFRVKILGW